VRVDSGAVHGSEVGVYYDPLIAKLIVWGPAREAAIRRMHRALTEYGVSGLKTTIPFARWVMENPRFISGDFDTRFIEQEYHGATDLRPGAEVVQAALAAATLFRRDMDLKPAATPLPPSSASSIGWKRAGRQA